MPDQAHNLRSAVARNNADTIPQLPAVAVTGGKGGVGKTSIAVNLALMLAKLGKKPLLVDCDLSLANADVLLGVTPTTTLFDVLNDGTPIAQAIVKAPGGIGFIPAASGREELTRLSQTQLNRLLHELGKFADAYDLTVIDTPAGIGREVMTALRAARIVLVVVTPEPTSLTDAYALIKVLETTEPGKDIRVVINMANNASDGSEAFTRIRHVVNTYLKRDLILAGTIPRDRIVSDAVRRRSPFVNGPDNAPVQAIRALAMRIKSETFR